MKLKDKFFYFAHSYTVLAPTKFTFQLPIILKIFPQPFVMIIFMVFSFIQRKVSIKENKLLKILLKNVKKKELYHYYN